MALGILATLSSLDDNNRTASIQKVGKVFEWFTSEEKICMNASINFLNVGNITLCNEFNVCVTFITPIIKRTVDNNYTHMLHIYGYVIWKSTVPEAAIQSLIGQTICLSSL